jgi:hypothetical protein
MARIAARSRSYPGAEDRRRSACPCEKSGLEPQRHRPAVMNVIAVIGGAIFAASSGRSTMLFNAIQVPWWSALVPAAQFLMVYLAVVWLERRRSRVAAVLA